MNKTLIKRLSTVTIIALSVLSLNAQAAIFITPKAPLINAAAYIVMDHHSGAIIASSKADEKRSPASLTKLMTAYVVFQLIKDHRISLEDDVKISKKAWRTGGSKSFVEVGKNIKLKTLLKGMIIQSGNDSAVALAEHIAGTEGTFATYMNEYAKELGMNNTRFENASGLPHKDQHTTARDMVTLASATIRDFPQFYLWYSQKEFTYHGIKQHNRNKLLESDHTVDGLKTGFTKRAGYNLVASAKRVGMRLISPLSSFSILIFFPTSTNLFEPPVLHAFLLILTSSSKLILWSLINCKQHNRNKLLWSDHTVDGLKTGFTKRAGYNLVASAKRVGMRLISVKWQKYLQYQQYVLPMRQLNRYQIE
jgi:D-alanyl-D-alanine carboxypeptidase